MKPVRARDASMFVLVVSGVMLAGCARTQRVEGAAEAPPRAAAAEPVAERTVLGVGDAAPSIAGVEWVAGEKVEAFEPGTIYVLDMWATWCKPCIEQFPHTSALQEKFAKDKVKVVAISIWESGRPLMNFSSNSERVRTFVEKNKDAMRFSVAYEGDSTPVAVAYMRAAHRVSIPSVFVVGRDGKIAWIGHPGFGLAGVVERMVAGTFDPAKEEEMIRDREARRLKGMQLATQLQKHWQAGAYEEAVKVCDQILALDKERTMFAPTTVSKFTLLLTGVKDVARAEAFAREAVKEYPGNPTVLVGLAGTILTAQGSPERNVALAHEFMSAAQAASGTTAVIASDSADMEVALRRLEEVLPLANEPVHTQILMQLQQQRGLGVTR